MSKSSATPSDREHECVVASGIYDQVSSLNKLPDFPWSGKVGREGYRVDLTPRCVILYDGLHGVNFRAPHLIMARDMPDDVARREKIRVYDPQTFGATLGKGYGYMPA